MGSLNVWFIYNHFLRTKMAEPKMLTSKETKTFYDEKKKIWSGEKYRGHYNPGSSIGQIVFEELRKNPNRICQISISDKTQLTNEEVMHEAVKLAKYFESLGVKQHDVIAIVAGNTTHLLPLVFACFFHGSAFQGINPGFDKTTIKLLLNKTRPKIIFCDGNTLEKVQQSLGDWNPTIVTMKPHASDFASIPDLLKVMKLPSYYEPAELEQGIDQNMCILCSSGSTGKPKAVTVSNRLRSFDVYHYLTSEDVQFVTCVLEWITCVVSMLSSVVYGAKRIIVEGFVTADQFIEIVDKYKVTFTVDAPTLLAGLLKSETISAEKLKTMRYLLFGGGKCSFQTRSRVQSYMPNCKLIFIYGFTEIWGGVSRNSHLTKKPNSVGPLGEGIQAKVLSNDGKLLGPNEVGELLLYNGNKWQGYYNDPEATALMYDKEGWIHTGDLAFFDEDGYLYIVDRKKDLLKYQEEHYMPGDIEEVIAHHPDVTHVCVFGIYTELDGDAAAAVVVTKPGSKLTAEGVVAYVRDNTECIHKHLHAGAAIWDEIPRLPNGKVDRSATKKKFIEQNEKKAV